MAGLFSIGDVNSFSDDQFEAVFGNVIELCTNAAVQVGKRKPFENVFQLCDGFHQYLDQLTEEEKLVILRLHPDLAGRLAVRVDLTAESTNEQRSAGLNDLTEDQKSIIDSSNQSYKTKFGFPFIICARENKVNSIIAGLSKRYNNTREEEIATGINEVKKICMYRILDIVKEE